MTAGSTRAVDRSRTGAPVCRTRRTGSPRRRRRPRVGSRRSCRRPYRGGRRAPAGGRRSGVRASETRTRPGVPYRPINSPSPLGTPPRGRAIASGPVTGRHGARLWGLIGSSRNARFLNLVPKCSGMRERYRPSRMLILVPNTQLSRRSSALEPGSAALGRLETPVSKNVPVKPHIPHSSHEWSTACVAITALLCGLVLVLLGHVPLSEAGMYTSPAWAFVGVRVSRPVPLGR